MMKRKLHRAILIWLAAIGTGGTSFQLSGCDEQIRVGVITGLGEATETLADSLLAALFTSLINAGQDDDLTGGGLTGGGTPEGG